MRGGENKRKGKRRKEERKKNEQRRERGGKTNKGVSLLSKIYGNRTVGFCWSKRQSRSTHQELHMGTKILEFCQTPQGREFSYFDYF